MWVKQQGRSEVVHEIKVEENKNEQEEENEKRQLLMLIDVQMSVVWLR